MQYKRGSKVVLRTPGNDRLNGARGVVKRLTEWGAFVATPAAATGEYRAAWDEMVLDDPNQQNGEVAREKGYIGDPCDACGALKMKRNGSCLVCDDCGATSGCS